MRPREHRAPNVLFLHGGKAQESVKKKNQTKPNPPQTQPHPAGERGIALPEPPGREHREGTAPDSFPGIPGPLSPPGQVSGGSFSPSPVPAGPRNTHIAAGRGEREKPLRDARGGGRLGSPRGDGGE